MKFKCDVCFTASKWIRPSPPSSRAGHWSIVSVNQHFEVSRQDDYKDIRISELKCFCQQVKEVRIKGMGCFSNCKEDMEIDLKLNRWTLREMHVYTQPSLLLPSGAYQLLWQLLTAEEQSSSFISNNTRESSNAAMKFQVKNPCWSSFANIIQCWGQNWNPSRYCRPHPKDTCFTEMYKRTCWKKDDVMAR